MARHSGYDTAGFVGLLVPDDRFNTSTLLANDGGAGASSYSEAGRRPGVPEYDRDEIAITSTTAGDLGPHMALETTGEQGTSSYHVKALKGGMPGDQVEVVMRPALDSTAPWRGHQSLNVVEWHGVDSDSYDRGSVPADGSVNYASTRTADNMVLFVSVSGTQVRGRKWDPKAHDWNAALTIIADATANVTADLASFAFNTSLLVEALLLPTGRILVFNIVSEIYLTGSGNKTLFVHYSDDNGATWRSGNYLALDQVMDSSTDDLLRIRATYSNESVLLLVEYDASAAKYVRQFASDDLGMNFKLVEDWATDAVQGRYLDCVTDDATGMITVIYADPATNDVLYRRIASPFSPILSAPALTLATTTASNIKAAAAEDGRLYVAWRQVEDIEMALSTDGGATWVGFGSNLLDTDAATISDFEFSIAQGRAVWIVADPGGGVLDPSEFLVVESGGWSTLCQPRVPGIEPTELLGFGGGGSYLGRCWLPFALPDACGWAHAGTGTSVMATAAPYGVVIGSTFDKEEYYLAQPTTLSTGFLEDGVIAYFSLRLLSGTPDLDASDVAVEIDVCDNATSRFYKVFARFSGTQVRFYDDVAGAAVGTADTDCTTTRMNYKLAVREHDPSAGEAAVTLYERAPGSDVWATVLSYTSLQQDTSMAIPAKIVWGHPDTGANCESMWHYFHITTGTGKGFAGRYGDDLALDTLAANKSPYVLYGARLPSAPYKLWLDQGLYIHGSSGPAVRGDTWRIEPTYDYPVSNLDIFSSPSPGQKWRSTGTASVCRIAWAPGGGISTRPPSTSHGITVLGANFPACTYRGWTGAAWTTLATLNFTKGLSGLRYTRTGDVITVDTTGASTATRWIARNELVGCTFAFGGGAGNLHRIAANTEGSWTATATKRPTLILEGITGAEPGSGTAGAIWMQEAVGLSHESSTTYTRYCIEIPAGSTVDGYYEIGAVVVGSLAVFAHKYSRNRSIQTAPNAEVWTSTSGQRTARRLGPARRTIEASWVEGYDSSGIWASAPTPDYTSMRSGSTKAVAARGDSTLLESIIRETDGPVVPVVYLPRIPVTSSGADYTQLAGREAIVYGRLVSTATRETVLGDENLSEVVRVTGLVLEEEI